MDGSPSRRAPRAECGVPTRFAEVRWASRTGRQKCHRSRRCGRRSASAAAPRAVPRVSPSRCTGTVRASARSAARPQRRVRRPWPACGHGATSASAAGPACWSCRGRPCHGGSTPPARSAWRSRCGRCSERRRRLYAPVDAPSRNMEGQEVQLLAFVLSTRDLSVVAADRWLRKFQALDLPAADLPDPSGR